MATWDITALCSENMADDNLEFDFEILEAFSCVNSSDHEKLTLF